MKTDVKPVDITEEAAREASTADLVVGISTAAATYMAIMRQGGPDKIAEEAIKNLRIMVQIGQMKEDKVEEESQELRRMAEEQLEIVKKTFAVYSPELNRRVPVPTYE